MQIFNTWLLVPETAPSIYGRLFTDYFLASPVYAVKGITTPSEHVVLPETINIVIVTGLSPAVLQTTFLSSCQAVLGNNTSFQGRKYLFTDTIQLDENDTVYAYLSLFDGVYTLQSSPFGHQVQHPLCSLYSESNIARRAKKPEHIGLYIPRNIADRNPFFRKTLCDILTKTIIRTFEDGNTEIKLLSFSEQDQSVCVDILECFQKHDSSFAQVVSIVNLVPKENETTFQALHQLQDCIDGLIAWDHIVATAASFLTIPCVVFDTGATTVTSLIPQHGNQIIYEIHPRYQKPCSFDTTSLETALKTLKRGFGGLQMQNDVTAALTLDQFLLQEKALVSNVVVGPLPWVAEDTVKAPHQSTVQMKESVPALNTLDIDERAMLIYEDLVLFQQSQNSFHAMNLAQFACYKATSRSEPSKYAYGLAHLIKKIGNVTNADGKRKLLLALHWLVKDTFMKGISKDYPLVAHVPQWLLNSPESIYVPDPAFKINVDSNFRQSSFAGVHRSGWAYVKNGLAVYEDPESALFVDLYSDATFGWMHDILTFSKKLPFTTPWVGIFHHAWKTFPDPYSVSSAVIKQAFAASLSCCRALIVLSTDLAQRLSTGLQSLYCNQTIPPIIVLTHPTEFVPREKMFSMAKLRKNPKRRVVQIGSFYRQSFSIYALPLGIANSGVSNPLLFHKTHLRGVDSSRYFKPKHFETSLKRMEDIIHDEDELKSISNEPSTISTLPISCLVDGVSDTLSSVCDNVYLRGLSEHLSTLNDSVEILSHLTNDEYDTLLSENVVFIHLTNASAVNTICESIVRNTPILVNPLPAVVEALGSTYPLYFTDLREAAIKLTNEQLIENATEYLSKLDKSKFKLDHFLMAFRQALSS